MKMLKIPAIVLAVAVSYFLLFLHTAQAVLDKLLGQQRRC